MDSIRINNSMPEAHNLEKILLSVSKPGRYIGEEWNIIKKKHIKDRVKFALAFPDIYEVGMSYLGYRIVYGLLNDRADVVCERVFAPWTDLELIMRKKNIPLFTLESKTPLRYFDIVGFSLTYELNYTNVLNMLNLSGISLFSEERSVDEPLIMAGGPCCFNPEPMAKYFDLFLIGEAEEALNELIDSYKFILRHTKDRNRLLRALAEVEGVYVPRFYKVEYYNDGRIKKFFPIENNIPSAVTKRYVKDLNSVFFPIKQIVPYVKTIHDRMIIELMRGCPFRCRFCQASRLYSPLRLRSQQTILKMAKDIYLDTGYDEISLLSLSTASYPRLDELCFRLIEEFREFGVGISLPSLRCEEVIKYLPMLISQVRKTGLTFAPEAGTERLHRVINKDIDIDKLLDACSSAFRFGWRLIKLYFIIGLPTETDYDVEAIVELVRKVSMLKRDYSKSYAEISVSVTALVPKPHTEFEYEKMEGINTIMRRQQILKKRLRGRFIRLKLHNCYMSFLEGVLSRGDRRISDVIYQAWRLGARFDAWDEHFKYNIWMQAFKDKGIDQEFYLRCRDKGELLPWRHIRC